MPALETTVAIMLVSAFLYTELYAYTEWQAAAIGAAGNIAKKIGADATLQRAVFYAQREGIGISGLEAMLNDSLGYPYTVAMVQPLQWDGQPAAANILVVRDVTVGGRIYRIVVYENETAG